MSGGVPEETRKAAIELLRMALISTFKLTKTGLLRCSRCDGLLMEMDPTTPHRPEVCEVANALEMTKGLA